MARRDNDSSSGIAQMITDFEHVRNFIVMNAAEDDYGFLIQQPEGFSKPVCRFPPSTVLGELQIPNVSAAIGIRAELNEVLSLGLILLKNSTDAAQHRMNYRLHQPVAGNVATIDSSANRKDRNLADRSFKNHPWPQLRFDQKQCLR